MAHPLLKIGTSVGCLENIHYIAVINKGVRSIVYHADEKLTTQETFLFPQVSTRFEDIGSSILCSVIASLISTESVVESAVSNDAS